MTKKKDVLQSAPREYILFLIQKNDEKIEELTTQNIGFADELSRRR